MKALIYLLPIVISGCSFGINDGLNRNNGVPSQARVHQIYELFKIDTAIRQIDYDKAQARRAISVNDAENVYLERFAKDLQNKRDRITKESEDEARRHLSSGGVKNYEKIK